MEIKRRQIHMNCEKGRALSQITLDEDYNLPDYKTDMAKVIKTSGTVKYEDIKVSDGHIWVRGNLQFQILYRSAQEEKQLDVLKGVIPFQENISMDGIEELDPVSVTAEIEDITIGIINSRKLNIRALLMFHAQSQDERYEEVITDVESTEPIELKKENRNFLQLATCKKDTFRFRHECNLSSDKPNIREILWEKLQLRGLETRVRNGAIELSGEVLLYLLYRGEEEENRLLWIESSIPFQGSVECQNCEEGMISRITTIPVNMDIDTKTDDDGEERVVMLDMLLELNICLWNEESIELVEDAYSLRKKIRPEYTMINMQQLIAKNSAKTRVSERFSLDQNQENILQICCMEGDVVIDNSEITGEGIQTEGSVHVEILYITTDDTMPLGIIREDIPFEQYIEIPGIRADSSYEIESGLGQLSAALIDNTQVEIKALIDLNVIAFDRTSMRKIDQLKEEEFAPDELEQQPGITGYLVREGDELWNIAKENHTTMEELMEVNQMTVAEIASGDKLLIVKNV